MRPIPTTLLSTAAWLALLSGVETARAAAPPEAAHDGASQGAHRGTTDRLEASASAPEDAELARQARLSTILRLVRARNPEVAESQARVRAAAERRRVSARLPDPELKYEHWGVPLRRPLSLGSAEMVMVGVRQAFPPWGVRAAEAQAAEQDVAAARSEEQRRLQELVAEARRAFAHYYRADQETLVHRDHVALTAQLVELARLHYQTGRGSQQDVLRLSLELSRLHGDLATLEQERRASGALLNGLMGRPTGSALGPAAEPEIPDQAPDLTVLESALDARRPEIAAAERAIDRSQAVIDRARREARLPSVMVGLDYQHMPGGETRHGYGAMVSLSLPWLTGRRSGEVAAAEESLRADQRALEAARIAARYELHQAAALVEGARQSLSIIDRDLLPQAHRAFEAARAGYGTGSGDAFVLLDSLRSYLQIRIERVRSVARLETSLADLARAAGAEGGER
jgi:outer membrane protein, heavy metal efflux system